MCVLFSVQSFLSFCVIINSVLFREESDIFLSECLRQDYSVVVVRGAGNVHRENQIYGPQGSAGSGEVDLVGSQRRRVFCPGLPTASGKGTCH